MSTKSVSMIGKSAAMNAIKALVETMAGSSSTVLILGESGTGKELIAQALHYHGPRGEGPFVPINCGAIPKELLESELFGHRKGAFTGALSDRKGRFEIAHGGTLFLDEIGDLSAEMQVKLLRVLQERCVEPLGALRPVSIDVRVIAATHRNLEHEVAEGRFREDLFYRLNVLPVHTAPLRERTEDIGELLSFFAAKFSGSGKTKVKFATCLMEAMEAYAWPGNIRELSNLVDRFSTLYPGQELSLAEIPDWLLPPGLATLKKERLPEVITPDDALTDEIIDFAFFLSDANGTPIQMATADEVKNTATGSVTADNPGAEAVDDRQLDLLAQIHNAPRFDMASVTPLFTFADNTDDENSDTSEVGAHVSGATAKRATLPEGDDTGCEGPLCSACNRNLEGLSLKQRMIDIERSFILNALERSQWNVSQASRLLSLQRTTLIEKINKYGLRKEDAEAA